MLPNIAYAIRKKMLKNLSYVQCLNIAPMGKAWFVAPMEYSPNGKDIMTPMEYISPSLIAPMEKAWFYEGFFCEVVMVMLKIKIIHYKRYNVNKN